MGNEEVIATSKVKKFFSSSLFKSILIFVIVFSTTFIGFNATIESTFVDGNSMYPTLNDRDYGIPQNRERIFVVGFRNDLEVSNFDCPPKPIPLEKKMQDF